MMSAPPVAGATPRPPWKPMNGERLWPTIAIQRGRDLRTGSPPMATISRTPPSALATSSRPDTAAQRKPTARDTLAPPVRPLPIVRGSVPADQPRNDDPEGNAAEQIAGDERDGDPDEVEVLHRREV
jgi:hypothetical protein